MSHPTSDGEEPETHGSEHDEAHHVSRWPIVGALGAGVMYAGVALVILAVSAGVAPVALGGAVAVAGLVGLVAALLGWLREAYLRPYGSREPSAERRESHVWTMLLFLGTDFGTFGALFAYYAWIRVGSWPPAELPSLLGSLVVLNTLLLVASSVTFHAAHAALERGRQRWFVGLLGTTVGLGVVFLLGQALEYYEFVAHEGFTLTSGVYASAFYGLTGLHGLHVALGVVLLSIVLVRALRGHYGPERDTSVATVGLYWHFVDVVWIFLVAVLYAGAETTF